MGAGIRTALSGRYVIERELGRGGSATVYLARDLKHGRRVALKVVTANLASSLGAERFLHEIRTTASLNHPHILPLFESGTADGVVYFTMPHVDGESLRDRLDREHHLDFDTSLRIARQMADALRHAHAAGIVHRDLKPENVLLGPEDHVWVVDFGLSRALMSAGDHRLSGTGLALGSPCYISPEQAGGESNITQRSDIYSFGCVVFEMLVGEPPYEDHSVASLLAKHLSAPAPSARERNPDVSAAADAALRRAMAKQPADRFADAETFVRALAGEADTVAARVERSGERRAVERRRRFPLRPILLATGLVAAVFLLLRQTDPRAALGGLLNNVPPTDSTRFVILPFSQSGEIPVQLAHHSLREAMAYWDGITLVDPFIVGDAIIRQGDSVPSLGAARSIARSLGAGRFVRGDLSAQGDSIVLYAALFAVDNTTGALAEDRIRFHRDERDLQEYFSKLADLLLFPHADYPPRSATASLPAFDAYLAGQRALEGWELQRADSLFSEATNHDPEYGRALYWLAHVRFWLLLDPPEWLHPAQRAAALREELPADQQKQLDALLSLGRADYPAACTLYGQILSEDPRSFAATYGLAECHRRDGMVLRDESSPSGWRFRSSGHRAVLNFKQAFELNPATHRAFRSGRFERLRNAIFFTAATSLRDGTNAAGELFYAAPEWDIAADTLLFYPVASAELPAGNWSPGETTQTALRKLRRMFFDVTTVWVREYGRSPDALEARATALELMGDGRALATLRDARALARGPEHQLNLAISEFWLRLKHAIPDQPAELAGARLLADSILEMRPEEPHTAGRLAAVAALTGHMHAAARLSRMSVSGSPRAPAAVAGNAAALLTFAAAGGPVDSIAVLEGPVAIAIANWAPSDPAAANREYLCRAASLSFATYRMNIVATAACTGDYLVEAQSAFVRGDHATARSELDKIARSRGLLPPAHIQVEPLVPEAWLLLRMGDATAARDRLHPTLSALSFSEPGGIESVPAAASLARALLLRAEIAHLGGDAVEARRWANAFAALWSGADPALIPLHRRAVQLARSP